MALRLLDVEKDLGEAGSSGRVGRCRKREYGVGERKRADGEMERKIIEQLMVD